MALKTIFNSLVTDSHDHDVEGVGNLRFEANGKVYRYVKNDDASNALPQSSLVCHTIANGDTANTAVARSLTANLTALAGAVASTTLAANTGTLPKRFGWIQVAGTFSSLFYPAGTLTAGTQFYGLDSSSSSTDITTANISTSRYDRFVQLLTAGSVTTVGATGTAVVARISGCLPF